MLNYIDIMKKSHVPMIIFEFFNIKLYTSALQVQKYVTLHYDIHYTYMYSLTKKIMLIIKFCARK